jgi:hypothetical protein
VISEVVRAGLKACAQPKNALPVNKTHTMSFTI